MTAEETARRIIGHDSIDYVAAIIKYYGDERSRVERDRINSMFIGSIHNANCERCACLAKIISSIKEGTAEEREQERAKKHTAS